LGRCRLTESTFKFFAFFAWKANVAGYLSLSRVCQADHEDVELIERGRLMKLYVQNGTGFLAEQ
jgi:hypothetical protein